MDRNRRKKIFLKLIVDIRKVRTIYSLLDIRYNEISRKLSHHSFLEQKTNLLLAKSYSKPVVKFNRIVLWY